jgi:hypothetical protein
LITAFNLILNVQLYPQGALEFQLSMYKKNKVDHMRFSSDHRADILTKALGHRHAFAQPLADDLVCP